MVLAQIITSYSEKYQIPVPIPSLETGNTGDPTMSRTLHQGIYIYILRRYQGMRSRQSDAYGKA